MRKKKKLLGNLCWLVGCRAANGNKKSLTVLAVSGTVAGHCELCGYCNMRDSPFKTYWATSSIILQQMIFIVLYQIHTLADYITLINMQILLSHF